MSNRRASCNMATFLAGNRVPSGGPDGPAMHRQLDWPCPVSPDPACTRAYRIRLRLDQRLRAARDGLFEPAHGIGRAGHQLDAEPVDGGLTFVGDMGDDAGKA